MLDAGEFLNSGLDINAKTHDVQYIKNRLEGMPIQNLTAILSEYSKNAENSMEIWRLNMKNIEKGSIITIN